MDTTSRRLSRGPTDKPSHSNPGYFDQLQFFVFTHCAARQYDSCVNSPCRHASAGGCAHPEHPKHLLDAID